MDTPGFGVDLREEELAIDNLVNFLQHELKYVNAFVIAFKQTDIREMVYFRTMMKLVHSIFGAEFWDHVIIEATFWGYSEGKMEDREAAGLTEDSWLEGVPKKTIANLAGDLDNLKAVYIDTYYRPHDPHQREQFQRNTEKLYQFAMQRPAFHCKDITEVKHELRELEEAKILIETQKKDLEESCVSELKSLEGELGKVREEEANCMERFYRVEAERNEMEEQILEHHVLLFIVLLSFMVGLMFGCCCSRSLLLCKVRRVRCQLGLTEMLQEQCSKETGDGAGRKSSLSMRVCYPSEYQQAEEDQARAQAPAHVGWISLDVSEGRPQT